MLINSYDEFQKKAKLEIPNSMSFTFLIHNPKEMNAYTDVKQKHSFVPVLYDAEKQKDLIEQMRLTFHDILDYASSMRGILSNGLIHTSAFGHITLDILGNLYAEESYIGNVKDGSAFLLMTEWLQKENNLWMLTRKTFRPCQKCILSFLCPCVSIYERQGYFETACVENLINDCFDNETYFKCK